MLIFLLVCIIKDFAEFHGRNGTKNAFTKQKATISKENSGTSGVMEKAKLTSKHLLLSPSVFS